MHTLSSFLIPPREGASRWALPSVRGVLAGLLLVSATLQSSGQSLSVTNLPATDSNAALALANAIKGTGIQSFSNVSFTGVAGTNTVKGTAGGSSAGTFSGASDIVGLPTGIMLSTGGVQNAVGPNSSPSITQSNGTGGDAHLAALIGADVATVYDKTVLEFDFVPTYPTIAFRYVFSSDEFNEYANSTANDVFGFFVNGTTPAHNIARIPGTSSPVSINTVNGGKPIGTNPQNAQYFRNNDPQVYNLEMDGLTVVLTAQATVTPGVVNHIKIAIADVIDATYDSNVFIEQGSFVSGNAPLAVNDAYKTPINTALTVMDSGVLANDTDADNNLQAAQLIVAPAHGTLVLNAAGGFTYTPATDYSGPDSFTYQARDATDIQSNVATVSLTVGAANAVPTSATSTVTVNRDSSSALPLDGFIFNDVDSGNSLTGVKIVSMSFPSGATLKVSDADVITGQLIQAVVIKNGGLKFSAAPGQYGESYASLVYQVSDGVSLSAEQTLVVDVTNLIAEVAVSGNETPITNGDESPAAGDHTDFGAVNTLNGTMNRVFTIGNTGTAALAVEYVTVSGAHQNDFQVTIQPATSVAPGESTTFTVQFDPSANGTRSATLNFVNSDGDMSPFSFAIHGSGYDPSLVPSVSSVAPARGITPGGTNVTLTGVNFIGATGVTIGGEPVTNFTVVSNTQITATTGAHAAGVVDVAVAHINGTAVGTGLFTYITPSSIAFVPPHHVYVDGSVDLAETAVASSGLAVTFEIVSGPGELSDDVLTFTGPGNVVVRARQAGDETYAPAEDVLRTLEVLELEINDGVAESWRVVNGGPESLLFSRNGTAKALALELEGDTAVAVAATGSNTNAEGNKDIFTAKYDAENGADIWSVTHAGSAGKNDEGISVAVDNEGNVIIAGTVTNASSNTDIYVAKYAAADGELLWEATYAGDGTTDYGNDGIGVYDAVNQVQKGRANVQIGASDEVFVGGYVAASNKLSDLVVLKFNAAGVRQWAAHYSGPANKADYSNALAIDASGDVFAAGGSNGLNLDAITVKFSGLNGDQLWEARYDGGKPDEAVKVALDSQGHPVIGGYSQRTNYDFLTLRYDAATGGELNSRIFNGPLDSSDAAWDMAVVDGDHVMLTGASYSAAGTYDGYTLRLESPSLDAAMPVKWGSRFSHEANRQDQMVAMDKDIYGNVVVTGYGQNADGSYDAYTAKYRAVDGTVIWQTKMDGPGGKNDFPRAVAMDPAGNAFVAGYATSSTGSTDFWVSRYLPTLGVDETAQVITFTQPPDQTYGTDMVLRASASSELPVSYSVLGQATLNGDVLHFTGIGPVTVTASQVGDSTYDPAVPVQRTFNVAKGRQMIAFDLPETVSALAELPLTAISNGTDEAGDPLPVSLTYVSGPGQIGEDNILRFTGSGEVVIRASQAGNSLFDAASDVVKTVIATRAEQTLAFTPPANVLRTETVDLALSTTVNSGLPVTYTVISGPGTVDGSELAFSSYGNVYVQASQAGDNFYEPVSSPSRLIRVANVIPELNEIVLEEAMVGMSVSLNISGTQTPTRYTATGLPPGITLGSSTGLLSGRLTAAKTDAEGEVIPYMVTFVASNSAGYSDPVTVPWLVRPLLAVGNFSGLVESSTELSTTEGQTLMGLGGKITLTVTTSGSFSGSLALDAMIHSFRGLLTLENADGIMVATTTVARGTTMEPLTLELAINGGTGEFAGTVTDGSIAIPVAFNGWHNPWNSVDNPASDYEGIYNAVLERTEEGNDAVIPDGNGYGCLTVTTAGTATWKGKLADGTATTISTTIGPEGQLPLFLRLYSTVGSSAGSVHGWSQISTGSQYLDGGLVWTKQAQTTSTRLYKEGFEAHDLTVVGGIYSAPTAGSIVLDLPVETDNVLASLAGGGVGESALGQSGGGSIEQVLSLGSDHLTPLPVLVSNPASVKLKVTPSTGLITGSFKLVDDNPMDTTPPIAKVTRSVLFYGMVVPRVGKGAGYFILGGLPSETATLTTAPQLSGQFIMEPNIAP